MTSQTGFGFDFLVVGAGRGGTSLLAGLLDAHPGLEVGFEHGSVATLMGRDVPACGARMFDRRVSAFVAACRAEAARFPGRRWGNKITTEQIMGLEDHNLEPRQTAPVDVLDRFFNGALAGVPVVFLLRDGRTCVRSKVARTGQSVALACQRWKVSVDVWRFLRDRHPHNLLIRYEDLVRHPRRTMMPVCDFLGVPWCKEMLAGTCNPKMLPEYRRAGVDEGPAALTQVPMGVEEALQQQLAECGYVSRPDTTAPPRT